MFRSYREHHVITRGHVVVLLVDSFSLGVFAYGVGYALLKYDRVDLLNVHDRTI